MGLAGYFLQAHFWGNQGELNYPTIQSSRQEPEATKSEFAYAGGQGNEGCAR